MNKVTASVAIFKNSIEYKDKSNKPETPSEVFEAALKVVENKGCEFVRTKDGIYIVKYSSHGPFSESSEISDDKKWMPVYVAKIYEWTSGGITNQEMQDYQYSK